MVQAGQHGENIRSDCLVTLEIREAGGIEFNLKSKVASMYGSSIEKQCREILEFFEVEHARVDLEDSGALPFVIAARMETAIKRALPDCRGEFLPPFRPECRYTDTHDRLRRSRLYLPGNQPKFMINAGLHHPDGVILDLEDSVAPPEKDAARILVRNALRQVDFLGAERMVRINQIPAGLEDLKYIVPHNVQLILVPKCEGADQLRDLEAAISSLSKDCGRTEPVFFMPIIESALGALKALEIATASPLNVALTIGLEDYTADIGTSRTPKGRESFWARCQVVNAARAAGLQPIDTVFSDVADEGGLRESVREARSLGFDGKGCIHPRQIKVVHEAFAPTPEELEKARRIVDAYEEARSRGSSVTVVGSKMIDPPVVKRAQRILSLAR